MTSIPGRLVEALDLAENGTEHVFGPFGDTRVSTYVISVTIGPVSFRPLEAIPTELNHVLIGRDLINLWTMTLDGKSETGEIVHWSIDPRDVSSQRIPR